MKILVLSFYFTPDLSAGSFRTAAFVKALSEKLPAGFDIDVLTTLPNRYQTFTVDAPESESYEGLNVYRIKLPPHKSGMLDQSKSFFVFSRHVLDYVNGREYDAVYATSSRLMTAVLAAWISTRSKIPLYLDIRDIFVDTIKDIFPKYLALTVGPFIEWVERWTINRANRVNLVSPGFQEYFASRYEGRSFSFFTNGIDDEFIPLCRKEKGNNTTSKSVIRILYAGNIGEGQGLHQIVPRLAGRMSGKAIFRIIGDGGRKDALRLALTDRAIGNVEIIDPIDRPRLIREYEGADVLFLHLNDYAAFKKVLPSKIFEYAATGKPIWAGVAGFAAEFLRSEVTNVAVFDPCDVDDAERKFKGLVLRNTPRREFIERYSRKAIMDQMAMDFWDMIDES